MIRLFSIVALALALATGLVAAHDYKAGDLKIEHPWSRATPNGAKVAGGYLRIANTGTLPDRLLGGTFAAAANFEVHEMSMDGGVMKMRLLAKGLEIKPGATVEFKPGGYHLMFTGLARQLAAGETVKGTLVFERAGTVEVEFKVEAMGASPPAAKDDMHMH